MQHICHSTQWDPTGSYIIRYNDSSLLKGKLCKNMVRRVYSVVGNYSWLLWGLVKNCVGLSVFYMSRLTQQFTLK